jgi:hypothetical protein
MRRKSLVGGEGPPIPVWLYPSGRVLEGPVPYFPFWFPRRGPLWPSDTSSDWLDSAGRVAFAAPKPPGAREGLWLEVVEESAVAAWEVSIGERRWIQFLSEVDAQGNLGRTVWMERLSVRSIRRLSADLLLLHAFYPDDDRQSGIAAIVDFRQGTIASLEELIGPGSTDAYAETAAVGPFARVRDTGDCLNVREAPSTSAQSLGCFRDGVLLRDRAETRAASGITWAAVATPGGLPGWASTQYLERGGPP